MSVSVPEPPFSDQSPEAASVLPWPSTVTSFDAATASVSVASAVTRTVSPDFASATAAASESKPASVG